MKQANASLHSVQLQKEARRNDPPLCNGRRHYGHLQRRNLHPQADRELAHRPRAARAHGWRRGHGNGREVAEAVAQGMREIPVCATVDSLAAELEALHRRLQIPYRDPKSRPGTTLVLVEIPPEAPAMLFHAGDSRLDRVDRDEARYLTVDHVPATHYAMQGALGQAAWEQQVHGEDRSEISQAFVLGNTFEALGTLSDGLFPLTEQRLPPFLRHLADRRTLEIERDAVYLLASDGFWAFREPRAWLARWPQILCRPETRLDYLLDDLFTELILAAAEEPSVDNATAIAFRLR